MRILLKTKKPQWAERDKYEKIVQVMASPVAVMCPVVHEHCARLCRQSTYASLY